MTIVYELRNVSLSHGRRQVLRSLSATIAAGRLTVIVGPNGAGKSTLLHALAGSLDVAGGSISFHARPLKSYPAWELAGRRAVLMQSSQIAFPFTAREIVSFGLEPLRPLFGAAELDAIPAEALARVDLRGFEERYYQELSGGEQQRVQLARALCQVWRPMTADGAAFLLLDEPTASLDIRHQIQTLNIARDFVARGGGVIAVLHDLAQAAHYADEMILLGSGTLVAHGPPRDVLTRERLRSVFGVGEDAFSPVPAFG